MTLAEEATKILGIHVFPGKWRQTIERLDVSGAFTRKHQMELLIILCERMEKLDEATPITYANTNKSQPKTSTSL